MWKTEVKENERYHKYKKREIKVYKLLKYDKENNKYTSLYGCVDWYGENKPMKRYHKMSKNDRSERAAGYHSYLPEQVNFVVDDGYFYVYCKKSKKQLLKMEYNKDIIVFRAIIPTGSYIWINEYGEIVSDKVDIKDKTTRVIRYIKKDTSIDEVLEDNIDDIEDYNDDLSVDN